MNNTNCGAESCVRVCVDNKEWLFEKEIEKLSQSKAISHNFKIVKEKLDCGDKGESEENAVWSFRHVIRNVEI